MIKPGLGGASCGFSSSFAGLEEGVGRVEGEVGKAEEEVGGAEEEEVGKAEVAPETVVEGVEEEEVGREETLGVFAAGGREEARGLAGGREAEGEETRESEESPIRGEGLGGWGREAEGEELEPKKMQKTKNSRQSRKSFVVLALVVVGVEFGRYPAVPAVGIK